MARITLQDWACQNNGCISPFLYNPSTKIPITTDSPAKLAKLYPGAWHTARAYMSELNLSIVETDQSYIVGMKTSHPHMHNIRCTREGLARKARSVKPLNRTAAEEDKDIEEKREDLEKYVQGEWQLGIRKEVRRKEAESLIENWFIVGNGKEINFAIRGRRDREEEVYD